MIPETTEDTQTHVCSAIAALGSSVATISLDEFDSPGSFYDIRAGILLATSVDY